MSGIIGGAGSRSGVIGLPTLVNSISDYEEGTFTPVCTNVGFNQYAYGNYLKLGNFVHVSIYAQWNTSGTPTTISGLPFTLSGRSCMGVIALNKVNTNYVSPFAYTPGNTSYFYIWSVRDDTTWGDAIASVASEDEITVTMHYQTT